MGVVAVGLLAVLLGAIVIWLGIGPDWLAWRFGAILTLFGVGAATAPIAGKLIGWAQSLIDLLARLIRGLNPDIAGAVSAVALSVITIVLGLMWIGAMLPSRLTKWAGRFVNTEMDHKTMWGGAVALGILAPVTSGALGQLFVGIHDQLAPFGEQVARTAGVG